MSRWLLLVLVVCSASAHELRTALLDLQVVDPQTAQVSWRVPALADGRVWPLGLSFGDDSQLTEMAPATIADGTYVHRWRLSRAAGIDGLRLHVTGLLPGRGDVLVRVVHGQARHQLIRLQAALPEMQVVLGGANAGSGDMFGAGIEHIWWGVDHLLFVACLMIIAGSWRRIAVTVTGFTIAHSLTLGAATLGLISVPTAPVEVAIAASVVILAAEIARWRRQSLTWRRPLLASVGFGLLHGLGFAAALRATGLPADDLLGALFWFNCGVEIGQLAFVLAIMIVMAVVRRCWRQPATAVAFSLPRPRLIAYAIGLLSTVWFYERVAIWLA